MSGIREVAQKAGVSPSTVSRVLNKSGYVSDETRNAVEKAMKELSYIPNELAGNLFKNQTGLVGVIVPDINLPFFSHIVRYLETELYAHGYKIMLCNTNQVSSIEKEYIDMLKRHMVDGIIMGAHTLDVEEYRSLKMPVITLDRIISPHIPNVCSNHREGGLLAAKKLLENRCRFVVQIIGNEKLNSPSFERYRIVESFLTEHGVKVISIPNAESSFNFSLALTEAQNILKNYPLVDGIFSTDLVAAAFVRTAAQFGRRVPEDLKIIGYDGWLIPELTTPTLTTVVQPVEAIAKKIVHNLQCLIRKLDTEIDVVELPVTLKEGGTTF